MNKNKNEIVQFKTDTGMVKLSNSIVRNNLAVGSNVTDDEIYNFMQLCIYRKLNPFLGQAHIVKFGGDKGKVQLITSKDVFISRFNNHPKCEGWLSGIIVLDKDNKIIKREGTFYLKDHGEKLVGAWFKADIKGWKNESKHTINLSDYFRKYKNKNNEFVPMGQWGQMPAVMLEKCVIVAGIRKTFPEEFGGMYSEDELGIESNVIDVNYSVVVDDDGNKEDNNGKNDKKSILLTQKEQDTLYRLKKIIYLVSKENQEKTLEILKEISAFKGKDGTFVPGVDSFDKLTPGRINTCYGIVSKKFPDETKKFKEELKKREEEFNKKKEKSKKEEEKNDMSDIVKPKEEKNKDKDKKDKEEKKESNVIKNN